MARGLLNKYIWILDTIQRYGRISRKELCRLWLNSNVSGGEPLARRTFYNYRQGIEELFNINIGYSNSTFEYYIDAKDISERVMLEEVPSARNYLPTVIEALKTSRKIRFSYTPFYRVNATDGIVLEPYFVRIFKQRWYVIGYNTADKKIKTYSLDRFNDISITDETFLMPDLRVNDFFRNYFGIITSGSEVKDIVLRVKSEQAKYFRALPLHHSQREEIYDGYSLFYYRMFITYDFVQELLSHGDSITVISPVELKAIIVDQLKKTLQNYEQSK